MTISYDYNTFLNDSSDDYPKYSDGIDDRSKQLEFAFTYDTNPADEQAALENVIMLARVGMDALALKTDVWGTITADALIARESIDIVKRTFFKKV